MFIVTADQRDSRNNADLVPAGIAAATRIAGPTLAVPPDRTAGDELQLATRDPHTVLAIALHLTRLGTWSVGIGIGPVESPLPSTIRAGRGDAFVHAREAVERAKRAATRLAITGEEEAQDAESLVRLVLELRDRRSTEGWEVYDLLAAGLTQRQAAERLGVSEAAVSLRAKAAGLRAEEAAVPALERVLRRADAAAGADE